VQFALRAKAVGNDQYSRSVQGGQHPVNTGAGPVADDAITEYG
jgi:hypothetical protein